VLPVKIVMPVRLLERNKRNRICVYLDFREVALVANVPPPEAH